MYEEEVSLEKSRTSLILIASSCSREIILTLRGVSSIERSVPYMEVIGRVVAKILYSIGISSASTSSSTITSSSDVICAFIGAKKKMEKTPNPAVYFVSFLNILLFVFEFV